MSSLADLPEVVGFFSYSRADDDDSRGALSALRDRIQRELRGQLGRTRADFRLWQDTAAIPHGSLWEDELKAAVAQSVFFIPIVTPTAVKSRHCQFEFESFLKREAELGRNDLVFPILYIRVPALEGETAWRDDPVLRIIHDRQYLDWQALRFHDVDSPEVGAKIERFCRNIFDALHERRALLQDEREKEAARKQAEEQRRQEAEAQRLADAERDRRAQEAEVARQADEERRRRESEANRRPDNDRTEGQAGLRSGPGAPAPRSTFELVVFPWKPIETPQQARTLATVGVVSLAVLAMFFLVFFFLAITSTSQADRNAAMPIFLPLTAFVGACAAGCYFKSRIAAIGGFAICLLGLIYSLALLTVVPLGGLIGFPVAMTACLATFAGVRGAFATVRFQRAGN
jgi:hypothetical protein